MDVLLFEQLRKKRLLKQTVAFLAAMIVLDSLIYYPLYLLCSSNVVWSGGLLFFFLTELIEPLLHYLFYWGSFAFALYACVRFSLRDGVPFLIAYAVGTMLRYAVQSLVYLGMMGSASWNSNFDLFGLLFSIVTDLLLMGGIVFAVWRSQASCHTKGIAPLAEDLEFSGFLERKNRVLRLAMLSALLPSVLRLLSRVYYDVYWIAIMGEPIKNIGEGLFMLTYYLTDCAGAVVGYLAILMMLSAFRLSEAKAKLRFEEPM